MKKKTRTCVNGINLFLREARVKSGFTQMEAALYIGHTTPQYVSNLERQLCEPSIEMAVKLCKFFGVPKSRLKREMISRYTSAVTKALGV